MRHFVPFLTFSLLSAAAFGQAPPLPSNTPGLSPAVPRTAAVPSNLPGQESMVSLQFPNVDVKELLAVYERLTKTNLVYDNQVIGTVSLMLAQEVPREEAIKIIEINLLLNGFTLVPVENSNILKVIGVGMAAAIFIDATVVRLLLVPAVMHLLGRANWWMPAWLDRLLPELHVEGHPEDHLPARVGEPANA